MGDEIPYWRLPADGADVTYLFGPDSFVRPEVGAGTTTAFEWNESSVYPGTHRRFWVHVPAAYEPTRAAHLAVFQDGWLYLDPGGPIRGSIVLDNLVSDAEIPVTIGVFVDPGVYPGDRGARNRNVEYDAFDDRYATLLLHEILPQVAARWLLSENPDHRLICGGSSGGNCAFTAAWLRPDAFGRVVSYLGSFAQMGGGNPYPSLIASEPRKPLHIFLQEGHRDLGWNRSQDNWLAENLQVAAALARAGYDFRLVLGDGAHSPNHGGVLLPDALRWHWSA
jgi:enterochelin esterase-like enzyme